MLLKFLLDYQEEILALTEKKILNLRELGPTSVQLSQGLPIFYSQLKAAIKLMKEFSPNNGQENNTKIVQEAGLTKEAESYGKELLRLNYSLSHVMSVYGALVQAITEIAIIKKIQFSASESQELIRCFDIAISGAISGYELARITDESHREIERLGFFAHEIRNALTSVNLSLQMIKRNNENFDGTTGKVLGRSLKRIEEIINQSLMEVRLKAKLKPYIQTAYLLQVIDQIVATAEAEAQLKKETLEVRIDPTLVVEADQELLHSALSNLIQNAIKFTRAGGVIKIRANIIGEKIVIEVEDECGGLANPAINIFKPFEQQNENISGLGLGLTITKQAIERNKGTIDLTNLPGKGCIFTVSLPKGDVQGKLPESKTEDTTSLKNERAETLNSHVH